MPIVEIHLLEGRDEETKAKIAQSVSEALSETADTPIENVKIIFHDMKPADYAIGGKLIKEIRGL